MHRTMLIKRSTITIIALVTLAGCGGKTYVLDGKDIIESSTDFFVSEISDGIGSALTENLNDQNVTETIFVIDVIDGDTLSYIRKIDGEYDQEVVYKGRLLCINAPEDTSKQEKFSNVSTNFLKELLQGKEIVIGVLPGYSQHFGNFVR